MTRLYQTDIATVKIQKYKYTGKYYFKLIWCVLKLYSSYRQKNRILYTHIWPWLDRLNQAEGATHWLKSTAFHRFFARRWKFTSKSSPFDLYPLTRRIYKSNKKLRQSIWLWDKSVLKGFCRQKSIRDRQWMSLNWSFYCPEAFMSLHDAPTENPLSSC